MYDALIVAGGSASRSGLSYNKVLYEINGKTILDYAIRPFLDDTRCHSIIVVVKKSDYPIIEKMLDCNKCRIVIGGTTRSESVYNGVAYVKQDQVLIHDAARPFINETMIDNVLNGLRYFQSVTCGVPVVDTLKRVEDGLMQTDINRDDLFHLQTPQGFLSDTLKKAHQFNVKTFNGLTCDASLVKHTMNISAKVVPGDRRNIKFTSMDDVKLLELILNDTHRV